MKKRLLTLLVCTVCMCGVYAVPTFVAETDTADYVPSVPPLHLSLLFPMCLTNPLIQAQW